MDNTSRRTLPLHHFTVSLEQQTTLSKPVKITAMLVVWDEVWAGDDTGAINRWPHKDLSTTVPRSVCPHKAAITGMTLLPCAETNDSDESDNTAIVWTVDGTGAICILKARQKEPDRLWVDNFLAADDPIFGVVACPQMVWTCSLSRVEAWDLKGTRIGCLEFDNLANDQLGPLATVGCKSVWCGSGSRIHVLSSECVEKKRSISSGGVPVSCISQLVSENLVAVGHSNGVLSLFNAKTYHCMGRIKAHNGPIYSIVDLSEFSMWSYVWTCGADGKVCIWRPQAWFCEAILDRDAQNMTVVVARDIWIAETGGIVSRWTIDRHHSDQQVIIYEDGEKYIGSAVEFEEGSLRHGVGEYHLKDVRDAYFGFWENDQKCGFGLEFNANGKYWGRWKNDERSGPGVQMFQDGTTYEGEWVRGRMKGKGNFFFPHGDEIRGTVDGTSLTSQFIKNTGPKLSFQKAMSQNAHCNYKWLWNCIQDIDFSKLRTGVDCDVVYTRKWSLLSSSQELLRNNPLYKIDCFSPTTLSIWLSNPKHELGFCLGIFASAFRACYSVDIETIHGSPQRHLNTACDDIHSFAHSVFDVVIGAYRIEHKQRQRFLSIVYVVVISHVSSVLLGLFRLAYADDNKKLAAQMHGLKNVTPEVVGIKAKLRLSLTPMPCGTPAALRESVYFSISSNSEEKISCNSKENEPASDVGAAKGDLLGIDRECKGKELKPFLGARRLNRNRRSTISLGSTRSTISLGSTRLLQPSDSNQPLSNEGATNCSFLGRQERSLSLNLDPNVVVGLRVGHHRSGSVSSAGTERSVSPKLRLMNELRSKKHVYQHGKFSCVFFAPTDGTPYAKAIGYIRQLPFRKSVQSKLDCICTTVQVIYKEVEAFFSLHPELGATPALGADDLFPILIYVIIKANVPHLQSELAFIMEFGDTINFDFEQQGYFRFLQLNQALGFVDSMKWDISDEDGILIPLTLLERRLRIGVERGVEKYENDTKRQPHVLWLADLLLLCGTLQTFQELSSGKLCRQPLRILFTEKQYAFLSLLMQPEYVALGETVLSGIYLKLERTETAISIAFVHPLPHHCYNYLSEYLTKYLSH